MISISRFPTVSFVDLSLILTKEVADDYKIRCDPEDVDKAPLIGAYTALLPILGTSVYCAARLSSLPEDTGVNSGASISFQADSGRGSHSCT